MTSLLRSLLRKCHTCSLRSLTRAPCFTTRLDSSGAVFKFAVRASSSASFRSSPQTLEIVENKGTEKRYGEGGIRFEQKEHKYFHEFMENSPQYRGTVFSWADILARKCEVPDNVMDIVNRQDWDDASPKEMVEAFRIMTSYAVEKKLLITDSQFDHFLAAYARRSGQFEDEDMIEMGVLFTLWPFVKSPNEKNYKLMHNTYDSFCCKRLRHWFAKRDMVTILKAADVFYWQRMCSRSHFLRLLIYPSTLRSKEPHHVVQQMFYLGLMRSVPETYKFYDLERKMYTWKDHYSLTEIALVAHSIFRLKSRLQYLPLTEELLVKSLKAFSTVDDFLLVTVSKSASKTPRELRPLLTLIQRRLLLRLDDFEMIPLIHALWLFSMNDILEEDLAQRMYTKILDNLSSLRVKEQTLALTVYTEYTSPNRDIHELASKVFDELQKPDNLEQLERKPFVVGSALHRLLLCGVFPAELLNSYLSYAKPQGGFIEALGIDVNLEVFHPDYNGARLNPDLRESLYKYRFEYGKNGVNTYIKSCGTTGKWSFFNSKDTNTGKDVLLELLNGREDHVLTRQLIPHFGYHDIVLRIRKDGDYLPIPDAMRESKPWDLLKIPQEYIEEGDMFVAVTFLRSVSEIPHKKLSCFQAEKVQILQKLGYIYIVVGLNEWSELDLPSKVADVMARIAEALSKKL